MRPTVPALVAAVAVAAMLSGLPAAGGAVGSATATTATVPVQSENVTVSGLVTDANGSAVAGAYVLVDTEPDPEFRKLPPSRLRELATAPNDEFRVARTDDRGQYALTVPRADVYPVIAVGNGTVSEVHRVDAREDAVRNFTLYAARPLAFQRDRARGTPGNTTAVDLAVHNTDDVPVRNLSASVGALPTGWTVVRAEPRATAGDAVNGTWNATTRTFRWGTLQPGERVSARLVVRVAPDAEPGQYTVPLSARSDSHRIDAPDPSVDVREWTPTPEVTATVVGGGDAGTGEPTEASEPGTSRTASAGPGFGALVALLALAAAAVLARLRDDR